MERLFDIVARRDVAPMVSVPEVPLELHLVQDRADVDISDPAFDFVRSIKVWHVEYWHRDTDRNGCTEYDKARLGSYGVQGDYRWARSSAHVAPAWMGIDYACRPGAALYRAVGVEWRDHAGNAGHEVVRY